MLGNKVLMLLTLYYLWIIKGFDIKGSNNNVGAKEHEMKTQHSSKSCTCFYHMWRPKSI
jgi:hypothetical protein